MEQSRRFGFDTRQVHAGQRPDPNTGARAVPIYQTTSYVFEDPESAAAYFNLQEYGNTYARIMNPTVATFEERIASLEGGAGAVAFASGLAGQAAALFTILQPGDHIVASGALYGGSVTQLKHLSRKFSLGLTFVEPDHLDNWSAALRPETKLLYGETIGNPGGNVLDIRGVADIAHGHGVPLMIDNTFATPYLCRPIEFGADIVAHSATKFLLGNGSTTGGIIVDGGKFDWNSPKFPSFTEPDESYHGLVYSTAIGAAAYIIKARVQLLRDFGPALSPLNSFQFILGIETLHVRMKEHVANAIKVNDYLVKHPAVSWVLYPGSEESADKDLVAKYLPKGAGSMIVFGIKGGREAGAKLIDSIELWAHVANVGDAKSLIIHPASTTHQQLDAEGLKAAGVGEDLIRLSVGIENVEDLIEDLDQAIHKATGVA